MAGGALNRSILGEYACSMQHLYNNYSVSAEPAAIAQTMRDTSENAPPPFLQVPSQTYSNNGCISPWLYTYYEGKQALA